MNKILFIYITHPSESHARIIADALITKKLIACANIFPIKSNYFWQGEIQNEDEWVSILKTVPGFVDEVKKKIISLHEYEVPCVIHWEVEANDSYYDWILSECKNTEP